MTDSEARQLGYHAPLLQLLIGLNQLRPLFLSSSMPSLMSGGPSRAL